MPRPKSLIPRLCQNSKGYLFSKSDDGKQHWFGHETDPASRQKYAEFLSQYQQAPAGISLNSKGCCSVNEVCLAFMTKYAVRYRRHDGSSTSEVDCYNSVIRILQPLFGETSAAEFGPLRLRTVRDSMVAEGWSRGTINKHISRVRTMFRFAASLEMISSTVVTALEVLPPLAVGESSAPDYEPRHAVPDADLTAVRRVLDEYNCDLFDLMLLTGARPGELLSLTGGMFEKNGDVWRADLRHHKTAKRGKLRVLFFNLSSQDILLRHWKSDPDAKLFPTRRDTFSKAIQRACIRAKVTPFCPHQLRHTVATRLADGQGIEAAQRLLGHSTVAMTRHYSQAAERMAVEAVKQLATG